jgi:hypothetical protein
MPVAMVSPGVDVADPNPFETAKLVGKPEAAAECVKRNVASLNTRLVAEVQPLFETETMGVVLRRGVAREARS